MRQLEQRKRQAGIRDGEASRAKRPVPPPESDSEEEGGRAAAFTSKRKKPMAQTSNVPRREVPVSGPEQRHSVDGDGETQHGGGDEPLLPSAGTSTSLPGPDLMDVEIETPPTAPAKHGRGPKAKPTAKTFLDEVIAERSKKKQKKKKSKADVAG